MGSLGAAFAVSLGAGGIGITQATTSSGERPIYLPIEPCRLSDTRPACQVGSRSAPLGPDETYDLSGWGSVGDCNLPTGTAGLALNVTAVEPTAPTFLTLFPEGVPLPLASNLNPTPGQPPTPNAVNVDLSVAGEFSIYNLAGNVHILIDAVGIYDDHNHDDRYYTETESDATFMAHGDIVMNHGFNILPNGPIDDALPTTLTNTTNTSTFSGDGIVQMSIHGPRTIGGVDYGLQSLEYCITSVTGASEFVTWARVQAGSPASFSVSDQTDRTTDGCYTIDVGSAAGSGYPFAMNGDGGLGTIWLTQVETTWRPVTDIVANGTADDRALRRHDGRLTRAGSPRCG